MQDIRKWFKKPAGKASEARNVAPETKSAASDGKKSQTSKASDPLPEKTKSLPEKKPSAPAKKKGSLSGGTSPVLKKSTHKNDKIPPKNDKIPPKSSPSPRSKKKGRRIVEDDEEEWQEEEETEVVEMPASKKAKVETTGVGRGRGNVMVVTAKPENKTPPSAKKPAGGRGRGGWGGGAFMGERAPPPHKGEKEVPQGPEDALSGLTFVISGTLDSLEREEAEDLIKSHGGRITSAVSGKTTYLLADEDVGGRKSQKAKELGVRILTEDGLFDLIKAKTKSQPPKVSKPPIPTSTPTHTPSRATTNSKSPATTQLEGKRSAPDIPITPSSKKQATSSPSKKNMVSNMETDAWPQKYAPKTLDDIVANPALVKQLKEWLQKWHETHSGPPVKKGKKGSAGAGGSKGGAGKKAVLISGNPGIGKTTTAKLVSQALGFTVMEVNASDTRSKADSKIISGIGGKTANTVKEMVSNMSLQLGGHGGDKPQAVLIMDEVDGMSGGDRGGVADLIASIKISRIPIICICNDRYARQLQSLTNHCLLLNFRKPTKQQMVKRLRYVTTQEKIQIPDSALEELGERANGDMRLALNQLQYAALMSRTISFNDVKSRLQSNAKDEELRPMAAIDRILGMEARSLRLDQRLDAAMSDIDLIPLMVQENYLNYRPQIDGPDPQGVELMERAARAADSIAEGDQINVIVRRYQRWQHLPFQAVLSSILPGSLMRGRREALAQGEMNFTRFPGWFGKNSTFGKNTRLLDELHSHMLASRIAEPTRLAVRLDYLPILADRLHKALMDKDVDQAVEIMTVYSLTVEDYETILSLIRFKNLPDESSDIASSIKGQLTRALKKREGKVRSADLLPEVGGTRGKGVSKRKSNIGFEPASLVDADVPVAIEENGGDEDEEGEGGEAEGVSADGNEGGVEQSNGSKHGSQVSEIQKETQKGGRGRGGGNRGGRGGRGRGGKTKAG